MQCATRPRITELNPHLLCVLCGGYYVDATAITECLHSFCKSCIVRYLETHKYCPICDVLVHKTKPLQNIRPDKILQSIVYKLVPNLYEKEMCNRRRFYAQVPIQQHPQNTESKGEITESSIFFTSNDVISLSLEYINFLGDQYYFYVASSSKRYLRCQASVTIKTLRKLIASKYELSGAHEIRFFFNGIQLPEHLSLLDIAYISLWKRKGFIRLLYQILEVRKTVVKLEDKKPLCVKNEDSKVDKLPMDVHKHVNNINTNTDQAKETNKHHVTNEAVPTSSSQIPKLDVPATTTSPTSIIPASSCTTTVTISLNNSTTIVTSSPATICTTRINESSALNKIVKLLEKKASSNEAQNVNRNEEKVTNRTATGNPAKSSPNEIVKNKQNEEKNEGSRENPPGNESRKPEKPNVVVSTDAKIELKKKAEDSCPLPSKIPKLSNNVCSITTTSSNICKEVKLINTPIMSVNPIVSTNITNSIISNPITPVFNYATANNRSSAIRKTPINYTHPVSMSDCKSMKMYKEFAPNSPSKTNDLPAIIKKPMKTAKTFTRPWNSTCTPTTVTVKPIAVTEAKSSQKPVKFFKARNTPRFLGNPASGIRPLYQVNPAETKNDPNDAGKKTSKNVSVLKIDPKTLCPIESPSVSITATSLPSGVNCKKPFPYLPPSPIPKLYPTSPSDYPPSTNAANYVGNLPAITSAGISGKLPTASFPYANMNHNPLLSSINPLLYGIYPGHFPSAESSINGPTSLDLMKAMAAFHPSFPPSMNPLYNPHPKLKHDKNQKTSTKPVPSLPAVQRVPPSSSNTKTSTAGAENTTDNVKTSLAAGSANVSNGVYKNKNKKSEISSFAINNLIPIDETKSVSHDCSADGVHQVCDQTSTNGEKTNDEKSAKNDEHKETEVPKSASN